MRRLLKENGLSLFFLALFAVVLVLQAIAGHAAYNNEEIDHAALLQERPETLSLWRYVTTSEFGNAVMENWQSEYLQFTIFVLATVWLVQKGSTESKPLDHAGPESDEEQSVGEYANPDSPAWAKAAGLRLWLYSNSLLLVMGAIFIASWFAQSVTGLERLQRRADPARGGDRVVARVRLGAPSSGRRRCRTGSRSSSPSGRWRSSASTSASAARRSQSPSAARTTRPAVEG